MTENELRINGKSFNETISQLEEFMESDDVHGELFTVLRSARDFMENMNEEIQQYKAIGTVEELKEAKAIYNEIILSEGNLNLPKECIAYEVGKLREKELREYKANGTIEELKALKEKNVAKKIVVKKNKDITFFLCPQCNKIAGNSIMRVESSHCSGCGQKLDWSE